MSCVVHPVHPRNQRLVRDPVAGPLVGADVLGAQPARPDALGHVADGDGDERGGLVTGVRQLRRRWSRRTPPFCGLRRFHCGGVHDLAAVVVGELQQAADAAVGDLLLADQLTEVCLGQAGPSRRFAQVEQGRLGGLSRGPQIIRKKSANDEQHRATPSTISRGQSRV